MALIRARHEVFGVADVPDTDYYRETGWTEVDASTPTNVEAARQAEADAFLAATSFDPAEHKAEEVVDYVADRTRGREVARVIEAEKSGKARKSVLDATD
jgi:hypothetical protein